MQQKFLNIRRIITLLIVSFSILPVSMLLSGMVVNSEITNVSKDVLPNSTAKFDSGKKLVGDIYKLTPKDYQAINSISQSIRLTTYDKTKTKSLIESISHTKDQEKKTAINEALHNFALWQLYTNSQDKELFIKANLDSMIHLVVQNNYIPNSGEIAGEIQDYIVKNNVKFNQNIGEFFAKYKPTNSQAGIYLAFNSRNNSSLIKTIWIDTNFNENDQQVFLDAFDRILDEESDIKKINNLIDEKNYSNARKILKNSLTISKDNNYLINTRLNIIENPTKSAELINSINSKLLKDDYLLYDIAWYYHKNKEKDKVINILLNKDANDSKQPNKWWVLQKYYSREAINDKNYKKSYDILAKVGKVSMNDYSEQQWTMGWLSLRFLNNSKNAIDHFANFYNSVSAPISLTRGSYWLGRSYEAEKQQDKAIYWYDKAAEFPQFFYSQIAIGRRHEIVSRKYKDNKKLDLGSLSFESIPVITYGDMEKSSYDERFLFLYLIAFYGNSDGDLMQVIKNIINDTKTTPSQAMIGINLMKDYISKDFMRKVVFYANRKSIITIEDNYPTVEFVDLNDSDAALIHSLIRQESRFDKNAVSIVGASGYMQVMPATAQTIAKEIGIPYSLNKLKNDPKYNIQLGSYYIKKRLQQYNGSVILAAAAYNGGYFNVDKWIKQFYDPREAKNMDEVIDFIELIPFYETRNYVQRIIESKLVYENILKKY